MAHSPAKRPDHDHQEGALRPTPPALRCGHAADHLGGTEHILLALLELEDGTGSLAGLGVTKARAEGNIVAAVEASVPAHEQSRP
jgi:hypothetical protein